MQQTVKCEKKQSSFSTTVKQSAFNLKSAKNKSNEWNTSKQNGNSRIRPYYYTRNQMINRKAFNLKNSSFKLTFMLLVISFSFVLLNLPYLFGWCAFFYNMSFHRLDHVTSNNLFAFLQFSEIFYVLNYGLKFFIFCLTESTFKNKLKSISKFI